jgi:DNA-binding response OmpR family regulator
MDMPLRILHLEDEPDFCELVKAVLAKDGVAADILLVGDLQGFGAALD